MAEHPHTNRLVEATSPYLLQHAHNPVDWYPWGEEALERARREEKPIFLSIGYAACHWCHVMERESFETEAVARVMNEHFVNIKVDREERPDLDDIYMMAVQMMTGQGGWPMSVFLTPDLKPFYTGTYFPPTDRHGRPGFTSLLTQLAQAWRERRADVEQVAERAAGAIREYASLQTEGAPWGPELIPHAVDAIIERFDPVHGGFGSAPKFPPSMALALILRELARLPAGPRSEQLRRVVTLTLDKMAQGGLYDQVGGGFHRYSTDHVWLVPHFEKMLYDNALLVPVYLDAYRLTGDRAYARVARETLDFTLRELTHPEGGFYSTLDADSEGEEGKFYVWTPAEVDQALGAEDARLFDRIYDITPGGNFEGKSIPHLERRTQTWARELGEEPEALEARLAEMRARLLAARAARVRPGLDDKILTSWNGLMIRAMAHAAAVVDEPRYREAAERAASFVLTHLQRDGRLLRSWRDGRAPLGGFHDDYAFLIVGLLELHAATGDAGWLTEARRMTERMNALFWDETQGGYFFTPHDGEALIARLKSPEDGAIPSGNSMAALALVRLARITEDADLLRRAGRLLATHAAMMARAPAAFPQMLVAADFYLSEGEGATGRRGRSSASTGEARIGRAADSAGGRSPGAAEQGAATGRPSNDGPVRAEAVAGAATVAPGGRFPAAVRLQISPGWHVNSHAPRQSYLIPTSVTLAPEPGFTLEDVRYPQDKSARFDFSEEELSFYDGETFLGPEIAVAESVAPGDYRLRLQLRYQPCSDRECLAPVEETLDLSIRVA
jgi:uncharacterized protein YyaL (SSP411 family)